MRFLKNQKGFGAFEGVIIVVGLVAIGAAGYFAYQARQDKTDYSVTVPKKSSTAKNVDTASKINYLTIKEWGVKVPQQPTGNVLSYRIDNGVADFVSSEQKAVGGYCGQFEVARYHVLRKTSGYTPQDDLEAAQLRDAYKKTVGGYTYYVVGDMSGGVCSDSQEAGTPMSKAEQTANTNLLNSLKGIIAAN